MTLSQLDYSQPNYSRLSEKEKVWQKERERERASERGRERERESERESERKSERESERERSHFSNLSQLDKFFSGLIF